MATWLVKWSNEVCVFFFFFYKHWLLHDRIWLLFSPKAIFIFVLALLKISTLSVCVAAAQQQPSNAVSSFHSLLSTSSSTNLTAASASTSTNAADLNQLSVLLPASHASFFFLSPAASARGKARVWALSSAKLCMLDSQHHTLSGAREGPRPCYNRRSGWWRGREENTYSTKDIGKSIFLKCIVFSVLVQNHYDRIVIVFWYWDGPIY